jgi:hypothetical protein
MAIRPTAASIQPTAETAGLCGPVFIVGMNGSGTTMLAGSLGKHPGLYMFPFEVRVLPYLLEQYERQGGDSSPTAQRRLADALGSTKAVWQANGWKNVQLSEQELCGPGARGAVDGLFRHFAAREGKQRWGEKSPMNVLHIEKLARCFPDARFIHIIRDGRDAAQSFHRRFGYCPPETIYRWKRVIDKGRMQGQRIGSQRYFEVCYEQLTADPEHWMRAICGFLDLPFEPVVLASSMRMFDPERAAGRQAIVQNSGHWQTYFSAADLARLESIAGRQLRSLGYEVRIDGDDNPSRLKLGWWRIVGSLRFTVKFFRKWGWEGVPGFVRSLMVSVKQAAMGRD